MLLAKNLLNMWFFVIGRLTSGPIVCQNASKPFLVLTRSVFL